jgi:translation elongation factor EF-G
VDAVRGVCARTRALVQHAMAERLRPVLLLNKLDVATQHLALGPEDLYQCLHSAVVDVNVGVAAYVVATEGRTRSIRGGGCGVRGLGSTSHAHAHLPRAQTKSCTNADSFTTCLGVMPTASILYNTR